MAWNGLDHKALQLSALYSDVLVKNQQTLYQTQKGKRIENTAKALLKLLSKVVLQKNIPTLFELEKSALRSDILCFGGEEKRSNTLAVLTQVEKLVHSTSTPAGAKSYLIAQNGGTLPSKIPSSDLVQRFVKSHKSYLTHLIEGTSSPALKALHSKRKDALDVIKKEYEKNLQLGLGKSQSKGLSR